MRAADVMTTQVISVLPETPVEEIAKLLSDRGISGVPVITADGKLVGVISEGDLLRRQELQTERRRSWWLELFASNTALAHDYVKSHGRKAQHVMTRPAISVEDSTPLAEIADLLESRRIKRVPVVRGGKVVGIVSRANLVQALASAYRRKPEAAARGTTAGRPAAESRDQQWDVVHALAGARSAGPTDGESDRAIRDRLLAELGTQRWAEGRPPNVVVSDGVVHLWGYVMSEDEREALRVAAENTPGVRGVEDHTAPMPVIQGL